MTSGLGFSIGTVNVVSALATDERPRPVVRTRRTAVGFDDANNPRLCGVAELPVAVTEFADLSSDPESVTVGGRLWSPANMVAAVARDARAAVPSGAGVVGTHPASYSDKQIELMRQAMDLSGVGDVDLVPEPVAATFWLEHEHGPLDPGYVLVYDLGGSGLDVTVVRVGAADHAILGTPQRCYDFGGRPLGEMIARCSGTIGSVGAATSLGSFVDKEGLRAEQVRDSLDVVRSVVRAAGVGLSDIGKILLVGGAARPPQVARTLAELGLPVVMSADPGHCVACGAAWLAARNATPARVDRPKRAPIFSGAAVFSAVAMSAATMLGNGAVAPENMPATGPMPGAGSGNQWYNNLHERATVDRGTNGSWSVSYDPPRRSTYAAPVPAGHSKPYGPPIIENDDDKHAHDPAEAEHETYSDPGRFTNPMPFTRPAPKADRPRVRDIPSSPHPSGSDHPNGRFPLAPGRPVVTAPEEADGSGDAELSQLPWHGRSTDGSDSPAAANPLGQLPQRLDEPGDNHAAWDTPSSKFPPRDGYRGKHTPGSGNEVLPRGTHSRGASDPANANGLGSAHDEGSHSRSRQQTDDRVGGAVPGMPGATIIPGVGSDSGRDSSDATPDTARNSGRASTHDSSTVTGGTESSSSKSTGFGTDHSFGGADRGSEIKGFDRSRSGDESSGLSSNSTGRAGSSRDTPSKAGVAAGGSLSD